MVLHLIIETQGMSALEKEAAQTRVFMPSDKECQTITTQNTNRHCRVRFLCCCGTAFVEATVHRVLLQRATVAES